MEPYCWSIMPKFVKKPIVIEAEQFDPNEPLPFPHKMAIAYDGTDWYVTTAHGQRVVIVSGDWIIPEPDNRGFYPIKDDIFRQTYDPVTPGNVTISLEDRSVICMCGTTMELMPILGAIRTPLRCPNCGNVRP